MDRVPILKIGDLLLVSIQVDMHDRMALALQEDLTEQIVRVGAHGVLIDISALDIVDSFIGRMLGTITAMSRVLDAETVVVGMRPAVAITLVELGMSLRGIRTALDVERGMQVLQATGHTRTTVIVGGDEADDVWGDATAPDPDPDPPRRRRMREETDACPVTTRSERGVIADDDDVVRARQLVRQWSVEAGFGIVDQTKIVTAASELARNTLIYGGGGTITVEAIASARRTGLRLVFADEGPGIADMALALTDGYTTGAGLGLGLSGARRLADQFDITSAAGAGTTVTIVKWLR